MTRTPDFIVIGSGPNGLTAACVLARAGASVLVLEAHPSRPGGAVASEEATLPGFVHDVGAAFFTFGKTSPAFRALELERDVVWRHCRYESAHPALDGSCAAIGRGPDGSDLGDAADSAAWRSMAERHRAVEPRFLQALLAPVGTLPELRPRELWWLARTLATSGRRLSERMFRRDAARRVLPGLGLHVDTGPDDTFGAGIGYVLGAMATTNGFAVPAGGAGAVTSALLSRLHEAGGALRLESRVTRVVTSGGKAVAVRTARGDEIEARRGVLAATGAPSLYLELLAEDAVPGWVRGRMRRFPRGFGTFKLDWALADPVPWRSDAARGAAVVHTGEDLDDLARFTREVRAGRLPDRPYLVVGQQSLCDPSRSPSGKHTLWAYSRVPGRLAGGWPAAVERFADRIDERIEALAPGFRERILARRVVAPPDLEQFDANLVDGDLGGGSNAWHRQLVFRPVFPYFRYRTPVAGLYLASSDAHPGAGAHGMCGFNAAGRALRET